MIVVFFLVSVCYTLLILNLTIGFYRVKEFLPEKAISTTKFSIIIPFRNEAQQLPVLLQSIAELDYPTELFEVVFVDDASEDDSASIIEDFFSTNRLAKSVRFTIIKNNRFSNSPKKDAIVTAVNKIKHDWIVTTDADCKLPKKWLQTLATFIATKNPKMVVGGVTYKVNNSFLQRFQLLDFLSLQASTIGGFGLRHPFLSNGANLAYQKDTFLHLNAFEGNSHIASGDDVFLFEKFLKHDKKSVQFLKSKVALVSTFPVASWSSLLQQRVRWASKTSQVSLVLTKLIGLIVFLMNLSLIVSLVLSAFQIFSFQIFVILFAVKFTTDLILFLPIVSFYNYVKHFQKSYFLSCLMYPFFSVFVVMYSSFFKFKWKGRSFKR